MGDTLMSELLVWRITGLVFSSVRDRVTGSRKYILPNWSSSVEMETVGLASFSSLSNSRRTEA